MSYTVESCIQDVKAIESLLEEKFGAHGRGLHEKITSSGNNLSAMEIRCLRAVASARNKLLHDSNYNLDNIPDDFHQLCTELVESISKKGRLSGSYEYPQAHSQTHSSVIEKHHHVSKTKISTGGRNGSFVTPVHKKENYNSDRIKNEITSIWIQKIIKPISQTLGIPIAEALNHIKIFMDEYYPRYYERYNSFIDREYGKDELYEEFGMRNRKKERAVSHSSALNVILTLLISHVAGEAGKKDRANKIISNLREKELFP